MSVQPGEAHFAEQLLLRATHQKLLKESDFEADIASASLSAQGRKKVVALVRDELAKTIHHRSLGRRVTYEQLLHLEALKLEV